MKKTFTLGLATILTITTLLFSGCSNSVSNTKDSSRSNNSSLTSNNSAIIKKDVKKINDNDLMNSGNEDSSAQLDSIDDSSQQLSAEDIDSLLDDNNDLNINDLPSNFSVK